MARGLLTLARMRMLMVMLMVVVNHTSSAMVVVRNPSKSRTTTSALLSSKTPLDSDTSHHHHDARSNITRRRALGWGTTTAAVLMIGGGVYHTPAAHAVQPRNEALCNTGLFEHFLEYRCTPLGNIQDEGQTKALSSQEQVTTDSLLSKLSLEDSHTTASSTNSGSGSGSAALDVAKQQTKASPGAAP